MGFAAAIALYAFRKKSGLPSVAHENLGDLALPGSLASSLTGLPGPSAPAMLECLQVSLL